MILATHDRSSKFGMTVWDDDLNLLDMKFPKLFMAGIAKEYSSSRSLFIAMIGLGEVWKISKRELKVIHKIQPNVGSGIHDVAFRYPWIVITDTTNDAVVVYNICSKKEEARWSMGFGLEAYGRDLHHINSIAFGNSQVDDLYITAWNRRPGERWRDASHVGMVINIGGWWSSQSFPEIYLENLGGPHSVTYWKNSIWCCESGVGILWQGTKKLWITDGFVRGIAFNNEYIYTSISRHRTRHSDHMYEGPLAKMCRLTCDGKLDKKVELPEAIPEVFELVYVDNKYMI